MPNEPQADDRRSNPVAVLIPAWQPEESLVQLAATLSRSDFSVVLVVDDGSGAESQPVFSRLQRLGIPVIRHAANHGKGSALKSGFRFLLSEYPNIRGVVTADADGQHTVRDITRVTESLLAGDGRPVLGTRTFGSEVPLRSRFGNLLTRHIFRIVTGAKLRDTQTGLRGFPVSLLPELIAIDGERYEYEMHVLAHLCRDGKKPMEVPIETVYLDGNLSSHFNPLWDSIRIYLVLARFYFSLLIALEPTDGFVYPQSQINGVSNLARLNASMKTRPP